MSDSSGLGALRDIWLQSNKGTVRRTESQSSITDTQSSKPEVEAALFAHIDKMSKEHQVELRTIKDDIASANKDRTQLSNSLNEVKTQLEKIDQFKTQVLIGTIVGLMGLAGGAWTVYTHIDGKYDSLGDKVDGASTKLEQQQTVLSSNYSELAENLKLLRIDSEKREKLPSDINLLNHRVGVLENTYTKLEDKIDARHKISQK
ncbi:TPA: hypothetical protein ACGU7T_004351 [Vibrio vulnificus]